MTQTIAETIAEQLERVCVFVERAIEGAPDAIWDGIDEAERGIWQHCAHIIEALEFYLLDFTADAFPWNHEFEVDWEDFGNPSRPTKAQMTSYLQSTRERIVSHLAKLGDEQIMSPETCTPWVGATYLDKSIYVLRHTTQHIGEMNQVFSHRGVAKIEQDR